MPQNNTIQLDDGTLIEYDPENVPEGFQDLTPDSQKAYILKAVQEVKANREIEKNASPSDILIPALFVLAFGLIIFFIAKRITRSPRTYDAVVKLDGEPNPHYGLDLEKPGETSKGENKDE